MADKWQIESLMEDIHTMVMLLLERDQLMKAETAFIKTWRTARHSPIKYIFVAAAIDAHCKQGLPHLGKLLNIPTFLRAWGKATAFSMKQRRMKTTAEDLLEYLTSCDVKEFLTRVKLVEGDATLTGHPDIGDASPMIEVGEENINDSDEEDDKSMMEASDSEGEELYPS